MRAALMIAGALLALALAGCGGGGEPTASSEKAAGAEAARQFTALVRGEFGATWDALYPPQQEVIPKGLYVKCASDGMPALPVDTKVELVETFPDPVTVDGTAIDAMSVTVRVTGGGETATYTWHEVLVDGAWRHVVKDEVMEAYRRGECPS